MLNLAMVNIDEILLSFIEHNTVTLLLVFGLLKILAKRSPSTLDDSVIDYLASFFTRTPKEIIAEEKTKEEPIDESDKDKIPGGL